jgi:tetratricopeptide (TPR) repeat protein
MGHITHRWLLVVVIVAAALLLAGCPPKKATPISEVDAPPTQVETLPTATPAPPPTPTPIPLSTLIDAAYATLARSDFAGAIEQFEQIAAENPDYAPAVAGLSTAYAWQVGQEPRALELAQQAVELAPDSAAAHVALSRAQRDMYNGPAALQAAEQAAEIDPDSAAVQAELAQAYLVNRQYDAALVAAERALELQEDLPAVYDALAAYYWWTGDAARAQAAITHGLRLQPDFLPLRVAQSRLWSAMGRMDEAEGQLVDALALAPDSVQVLIELGYQAIDRGDYEVAESYIDQAMALAPDAPQPYVARAWFFSAQQETDDARVHYRQALERRAGYPPAIELIGWTYINDGECDLAVRQFQTLMADQPRSPDGLVGMGFARLCDGDPVKALEYLRKAVKLDPYDVWAHDGLATAYSDQERWDEMRLAVIQALLVNLDDAGRHRLLGASQFDQDESEKARAEYHIAISLMPDAGQNSLVYANLAYLELMDGRLEAAEDLARTALRLNPGNSFGRLLLGMTLVRAGNSGEAIDVLEALVEAEPEFAYAHYFLGLAYQMEDRFDEARRSLETCLKLQPYGSTTRQITTLADDLKEGFYLTEEEAVDRLVEAIDTSLEITATAQVIDLAELDSTLVITLTTAPDQDPEEAVMQMASAAALCANFVARIELAIAGGIQVRLVDGGELQYTVAADGRTAEDLYTGYDSTWEFVTKLVFTRIAPQAVQATVDEIKAQVSATRELSPTTEVQYHVLNEEELRLRYEDEIDDDERASLADNQAMLALLGVVDPELDLAQLFVDISAEQVSGFYSLEERIFYLVDRGGSTTTDQMTLAHEYTHALQDQHYDLNGLDQQAANSDEQLAIRALVEGDATLAMLLYADEHVNAFDMMQAMTEAAGVESDVLDNSPLFIRGHRLFAYEGGLEFVSALHDRGGWEAVDAAYAKPPRSTEQILHPERYRRGDDPIDVTLPDLAGALGGQWQEADREVMGELALRLFLQEHVGPSLAELAAEGWGGDGYVLLRQGQEGPYLVVMKTVWDDPKEADQFWTIFQIAMGHRRDYDEVVTSLVGERDGVWWQSDAAMTYGRQDGQTVWVVIGPDAQSIETLLPAMND